MTEQWRPVLEPIKHLILDLDGAVYNGNQPIPGAVESIARLRDSGRAVSFCSNNSTRTRAQFAQKLAAMGIPADSRDVVNSSYAAGRYLADRGIATALVIGESGLIEELSEAGIEVFPAPADRRTDCLVVGLDRAFDYAKLTSAQRALTAGAEFIATNRDTHLPTETEKLPGSGTMVAAVEALAGHPPVVIGKPEPFMVELILATAQRSRDEILVVGDRLDTDIECGNRARMPTALVLTGVHSADQASRAPEIQRPGYVFDDLAELTEALLAGGSRDTCDSGILLSSQ